MDVRINVHTLLHPSSPNKYVSIDYKKKKTPNQQPTVEFGSLFLHMKRRSSAVRGTESAFAMILCLWITLCDDLL